MRFDVIREIYRGAICMVALPIAIIITLVQEMLFSSSETFAFLGRKVKSLNIFLGFKLEKLLSDGLGVKPRHLWRLWPVPGTVEPPNKPKSRVKIDAWGGTSVNPSEVFRAERERKDFEAMSEIGGRQGLRRGGESRH